MPPKPVAHEHIRPPAGSREHAPKFWQGFGLHASAGTHGNPITWDERSDAEVLDTRYSAFMMEKDKVQVGTQYFHGATYCWAWK